MQLKVNQNSQLYKGGIIWSLDTYVLFFTCALIVVACCNDAMMQTRQSAAIPQLATSSNTVALIPTSKRGNGSFMAFCIFSCTLCAPWARWATSHFWLFAYTASMPDRCSRPEPLWLLTYSISLLFITLLCLQPENRKNTDFIERPEQQADTDCFPCSCRGRLSRTIG